MTSNPRAFREGAHAVCVSVPRQIREPALSTGLFRGVLFLALAFLVGVSPAFSVSKSQPNDPYFSSRGSWGQPYDDQWGMKLVGFLDQANGESAWNVEDGSSRPVVVAIIDTGLDYFHPDLDPATVWRNTAEQANGIDDDGNGYVDDLIGWNFYDNDNTPWDYAGHGTHVAGIVGAATNNGEGIAGINRGVRIMPLKVLNFVGRGRSTGIAEAIFYAVANGARIINLSLGGHHLSKTEKLAIDYAYKHDVLVVVASGNEGVDNKDYGPAGLDSVLTVGAVDAQGNYAGFSNWGAAVDVAAPGVDILSLRARRTDFALISGQEDYKAGEGFVGKENRYYRATGTSFAAPFVTGVASLLLARNPDLGVEQLMRIIRNTARDIDAPGIDQNTGYGLLDARAALLADPGFFIDAHISGVSVVQKKGRPWVRLTGTADADRFGKAWIEIGEGENPSRWKKVSDDIGSAVRDGVLYDVNVKHLKGAKTWTLRLIMEHRNGTRREARFVLNLG